MRLPASEQRKGGRKEGREGESLVALDVRYSDRSS